MSDWLMYKRGIKSDSFSSKSMPNIATIWYMKTTKLTYIQVLKIL